MLKAIVTSLVLITSTTANAETIKFSNIHKGVDTSGTSVELVRNSENTFSGTILICEGGCDKFLAKATFVNNILTVKYLDSTETFRLQNFRLYPINAKEQFTSTVLFNCANSVYSKGYRCLNHNEVLLKYSL
jgi:hypothetical protein